MRHSSVGVLVQRQMSTSTASFGSVADTNTVAKTARFELRPRVYGIATVALLGVFNTKVLVTSAVCSAGFNGHLTVSCAIGGQSSGTGVGVSNIEGFDHTIDIVPASKSGRRCVVGGVCRGKVGGGCT